MNTEAVYKFGESEKLLNYTKQTVLSSDKNSLDGGQRLISEGGNESLLSADQILHSLLDELMIITQNLRNKWHFVSHFIKNVKNIDF